MSTPQNGQTHTTRRQQAANRLGVFDHFAGLTLKGLKPDFINNLNRRNR